MAVHAATDLDRTHGGPGRIQPVDEPCPATGRRSKLPVRGRAGHRGPARPVLSPGSTPLPFPCRRRPTLRRRSIMKSITVTQPWATLIVLGAKRHETRTWRTRHRGALAIHAAGHFPEDQHDLCRQEPFRSILRKAGYSSWFDLPTGAVLGTVQLTACVPVAD